MRKEHRVPMGLRKAYLSMHRQADAALARYGLTATQFVLLTVLAEEDGGTQQSLVERVSSDPNTIRPMLVALEQRGLVTRDPHPGDGRARVVCITRAGQELQQQALAGTRWFRDRLTENLAPAEIEVLLDLLERVSAAMAPSDLVG